MMMTTFNDTENDVFLPLHRCVSGYKQETTNLAWGSEFCKRLNV